jgi:hypothetical protein
MVLDTQFHAVINLSVQLQRLIVLQKFPFFHALYADKTGVLATFFVAFVYPSIMD